MRNLIYFGILLFVCSCSTVQVSYDYDKAVDFSKYKTYAYSEESLKLPVNQLNLNRIFHAVDTAMAQKGFTEAKDCDLVVDLYIKTAQRVEATATTTGTGYRRYGWGVGYTSTQVNYDEYTDGTMFISFVDKKTEKLIWQGIGTKTLDESMSPEKREQSINYAVNQILSNYPPNK